MNTSYFSDKELACQHCGENKFDPIFLATLNSIREELGFPLPVTSGYRCSNHPIEVAKSTPGAHAQGKAVDVAVSRAQAFSLIKVSLEHGITGLGVAQKGSGRFIHLDMASNITRPAIWSY